MMGLEVSERMLLWLLKVVGGNTRSVGRAGRWFSQALRFGEHAAGDSLLISEKR
jgi:hypothetical protein